VLPVLTDIIYDNLAVGNGGVAAWLLGDLAKGKLTESADQVIKDLLEYCKQDTWAMVALYRRVKEQIS
jgi:hypothetical protein